MTILFIARHFTYFRNFDSVIEALARHGHRVHLAADREDGLGGRGLVDALAAKHPGVTVGDTPIREWGRYRRVASALRLGLDYLRYSDARFADMPKIRRRAYDRTPLFILLLARLPGRRVLTWVLERIEEAVPSQLGVDEFITNRRPDLLLITPLIELGSPQLDYLRAARRHGIRSALCVWSWDHLSSKALIRVRPDAVLVWNEVQRGEAAQFHGIPAGEVHVTARSASIAGSTGRHRAVATSSAAAPGCATTGPSSSTSARRSFAAAPPRRSSCAAGWPPSAPRPIRRSRA